MANLIYFTVGAPGTGKSAFIRNSVLDGYALEADIIRLQLQSPQLGADGRSTISGKQDRRVWQHLLQLAEERMAHGETIVVDATHTKSSAFGVYKKLINRYRYRAYAIDFRDTSLEAALSANRARAGYKYVPEDVIRLGFSRYGHLNIPSYIKTIKPHEVEDTLKLRDFVLPDKFKKVVVFGDIHSSYDPLGEYFKSSPVQDDCFYVFLGDYFDRNDQVKEVWSFLKEHYQKQNFAFLRGNHEEHLFKYAFDQSADGVVSKGFIRDTVPHLPESFSEMREVCRKLHYFLYMEFKGKKLFFNHGGIPLIPEHIGLLSYNQLIKGVGSYKESEEITKVWNEKMGGCYQFHGHRNIFNRTAQNGKVFNLEGNVEFGGCLRIVEITDEFKVVEIKNSHFTQTEPPRPMELASDVIAEDMPVPEFVKRAESSKLIKVSETRGIKSICFGKAAFAKHKENTLKELPRGFYVLDDKILARGYRKCWHYGQKPDGDTEPLELQFPVTARVKENGYLGLIAYNWQTDGLFLGSKSSIDGPYSMAFQRIFEETTTEADRQGIKAFLKSHDVNLICEVFWKEDPHIVDFESEHIIVLDCIKRQLKTEFYNIESECELWERENMRPAASFHGLPVRTGGQTLKDKQQLDKFVKTAMDHRGIEGWVLMDKNNNEAKLKTHWYTFWKHMRSLKDTVAAGRQVRLGALNTPAANNFYAFIKNMDPDELSRKSISELRKEFLTIEIAL